jgi:GTP-binding protein
MDFMRFLGENEIPFSIVFTKTDKLSNRQLTDNIRAYKEALLEEWEELPPVFLTSSEKKRGREELLVYIDEIIHCS